MTGSSLCFAVVATLVKGLAGEVPVHLAVFARSAVTVAVVWVCLRTRPGGPPRAVHVRLLALRALAGTGALWCYFHAISEIPVVDAVMLQATAPVYVHALARPFLGERTRAASWGLLALSLAGVALILRPNLEPRTLGALSGLASGLLSAVAYLSMRGLRETDDPWVIILWFSVAASGLTAIPALGAARVPTPAQLATLLAVGLVATAAQVLLTHAYRWAPAGPVSLLGYLQAVFAGLLAWAVLGEAPQASALAGGALVLTAGALTALQGARDGGQG
ncbi:MAG: DMT family transporter [Planctomycetes bacterium]|nr:DMT family transporter [Planctomycetota bacterium]